jgi:hypothetical protein
MSNSIVMHLSRSDEVTIAELEDIAQTDDLHPIIKIAAAVINAGYLGAAVDEMKTADGRYVQALDVDLATPEGRMLEALANLFQQGIKMPEAQTVLDGLQEVCQKLHDSKVGVS